MFFMDFIHDLFLVISLFVNWIYTPQGSSYFNFDGHGFPKSKEREWYYIQHDMDLLHLLKYLMIILPLKKYFEVSG